MRMTIRLLAGVAVALALAFAAARCDKEVYLGVAPFDAAGKSIHPSIRGKYETFTPGNGHNP